MEKVPTVIKEIADLLHQHKLSHDDQTTAFAVSIGMWASRSNFSKEEYKNLLESMYETFVVMTQ